MENTRIDAFLKELFDGLSQEELVSQINAIRQKIKKYSPFKNEPVDCVLWVKQENLTGNDYNPNTVAPPEMKLLEHSISEDGYTQPVVAYANDTNNYEVVDGFHRTRVAKENKKIRNRLHGYVPITVINDQRTSKNDRIASTIRHNRARGKHGVDAMAEIIMELSRRNWNDQKIGKELGMEPDEVLRLKQITGLAELFGNAEFSRAWEPVIE